MREHDSPDDSGGETADPPSRKAEADAANLRKIMLHDPPHWVWESRRSWIQTLTVVAVALFGAWQFVLKEILWPAAAPINLTAEVTIKEAGHRADGSAEKAGYAAIELVVVAKNPSSRPVYLLPNIWFAQGVKIDTRREKSGVWLGHANDKIAKRELSEEGMHYKRTNSYLVAASSVFTDFVLYPNETISSSYVFYVPRGEYDLLNVYVDLPSTSAKDSAEYVWSVDPYGSVAGHGYKVEQGRRGDEITELVEAYISPEFHLQMARSFRQLSLWPSEAR
ncbi:MAG: hypothetical protein WD852_09310 [Methyloceanibacter sp.]